MEPLSTTEASALRRVLESQPTTLAKIAFAWRMTAGAAFDRATRIAWTGDGTLYVHPEGEAWRREVGAARGALLRRLQDLLGADVIARISISDTE
ncbi:MAG TPA: DciA family protein [Vicinamibacterales bacterium]|nr:DciA family protein [Vicinamibacterales bacterium]